jgi:hypothetical protein
MKVTYTAGMKYKVPVTLFLAAKLLQKLRKLSYKRERRLNRALLYSGHKLDKYSYWLNRQLYAYTEWGNKYAGNKND